jgi:hypothetical protein
VSITSSLASNQWEAFPKKMEESDGEDRGVRHCGGHGGTCYSDDVDRDYVASCHSYVQSRTRREGFGLP